MQRPIWETRPDYGEPGLRLTRGAAPGQGGKRLWLMWVGTALLLGAVGSVIYSSAAPRPNEEAVPTPVVAQVPGPEVAGAPAKVACPTCMGDKYLDIHRTKVCPTCKGKGYILTKAVFQPAAEEKAGPAGLVQLECPVCYGDKYLDIHKTKRCPKCKGKGVIWTRPAPAVEPQEINAIRVECPVCMGDRWLDEHRTKVCPRCKGKGYYLVPLPKPPQPEVAEVGPPGAQPPEAEIEGQPSAEQPTGAAPALGAKPIPAGAYRNETMGYAMVVPKGWEHAELPEEALAEAPEGMGVDMFRVPAKQGFAMATVEVQPRAEVGTLENMEKDVKQMMPGATVKVSSAVVGGVTGKRLAAEMRGARGTMNVMMYGTIVGQQAWMLTLAGTSADWEQHVRDFDRAVKSFTFLPGGPRAGAAAPRVGPGTSRGGGMPGMGRGGGFPGTGRPPTTRPRRTG